MSKMNNNSRKNNKNTKNTAKKALRSKISSKKNFKIENLEPRLMMDASAGFDVEKIDAYASQFEAIATTISKNASSAIEYFNEVDVSNVGVPKKFKPFLIGIARWTPTASAASARSYRQDCLPLRRSPRCYSNSLREFSSLGISV